MKTRKDKEYPGYIKINIKPLEKEMERKKDISVTDYNLPLPENQSANSLPYADDKHYDKDQQITLNQNLQDYEMQRSDVTNIVVRCDPATPDEVIGMGGFIPHPINPKKINDKKMDDLHPSNVMNPLTHRGQSSKTGFVSFSTDVGYIKSISTLYGPTKQFIYMAKVPAGILPETKFLGPSSEKEVSAVAGVDIQDVIAFRQLDQTAYDPDAPLYVRSSFIKNHPELLTYVMDRFTERGENPDPNSYFGSPSEKKKIDFPKSYTKMWEEPVEGKTEDEKLINKALALLKDYTKDYSRTMRIFTFHWGRNHVPEVNSIVQGVKENRIILTSLGDLLDKLKEINITNPSGSLAKRIQFIEEKQSNAIAKEISAHEQILNNEQKFSSR